MFKQSILFLPIILILAGCAPQGAFTLQRLANSQQELQGEVDEKEKLFSTLEGDIKNNRLQKGVSKSEIIANYGEPIFTRAVKSQTENQEFMLYRRPTAYFSSDLIYLYFDRQKNLSSWEIKPPVNLSE